MYTVTAVRNRILELCGEREITINKLATIRPSAQYLLTSRSEIPHFFAASCTVM